MSCIRRLSLLILTWLLVQPAHLHADPANDLITVVSPPPLLSNMSSNEVRAIFSMRVRVWPDGTPITVFVLPDSSRDHQAFIRNQLRLLPHQLKRNWERMVYTGIGKAPTTVTNTEEMLKRLLQTPGSIGYLPRTVLQDLDGELYEITLR